MIKINLNYLTLSLVVIPLFTSGLIRVGLNFINNKFTTIISITSASVIFIISVYFLWNIFATNLEPINSIWYIWGKFGNLSLNFGCLIDQLTVVMLTLITSLSLVIQIYSSVFMANDVNYAKYFAYIAFFNFSMIFLVIANNFLQLFFGWELVGISSYLLINFWFQHKAANIAAFKAFLVNRIGDLGLLLAIAVTLKCFDSLEYNVVFANLANNLQSIKLIVGLLVLAALTKSAQIPLHVWLPDAMEGPLPVSALMHSATMVTAGVFLLIRMSPILQFSGYWLNVILFIGTISAVLASLLALIEVDLKRIMAYSTISQIGLMFVAIGSSAYVAGMFHLITHAFFKSLLFLAIGSVFYVINNKNNNIFDLPNDLKKHLPITYYCLLIGVLSLIGFPGFSGFFSKNLIFNTLELSQLSFANKAYYLLLITNVITSLYMFRLFFVVFYRYNNQLIILPKTNANNKYNSSKIIDGSIIFLAVISCVIGGCLIAPILNNLKGFVKFNQTLNLLFSWSINKAELCTLIGVVLAFIFYVYKPDFLIFLKIKIKNNFLFFYNLLEQQYFFNKLNNFILQYFKWFADLLFKFVEELLFNKYINQGTANLVVYISRCIQNLHMDSLGNYIFLMLSGSLTILLWLILTTF